MNSQFEPFGFEEIAAAFCLHNLVEKRKKFFLHLKSSSLMTPKKCYFKLHQRALTKKLEVFRPCQANFQWDAQNSWNLTSTLQDTLCCFDLYDYNTNDSITILVKQFPYLSLVAPSFRRSRGFHLSKLCLSEIAETQQKSEKTTQPDNHDWSLQGLWTQS